MNRALDLDTIAPDDLSVVAPAKSDIVAPESQKSAPLNPPVLKKVIQKKKIIKSHPVSHKPKKIDEILKTVKGDKYSILVKPKGFKFGDCEDTEEILLVLRPHWFTNVKWVLISIVLFFVPAILGLVFTNTSNIFGVDIFPGNYKFIATLFWYLFVFIFIFESFLSWYFDVYIVTDRRVIDIYFTNLLDKKTSEANIEDIQDVSSRVAGLSQTLLNYGDVKIQTAATVGNISFNKVPNPSRVTDVIQELREEIDRQKEEGGNL